MSGRGRGPSKAQVEQVDSTTERGLAERDRAIDVAISQIERQFGKGSSRTRSIHSMPRDAA
jgi:hypothetical protein